MRKYLVASWIMFVVYMTTKYSTGVLTTGAEAFQGALGALALVAIIEWYLGGK